MQRPKLSLRVTLLTLAMVAAVRPAAHADAVTEWNAIMQAAVSTPPARPPLFDRYRLQRKALVMLRRNIHHNAFGRVVKRVRLFCDVLLRG